MGKIQLSFFQRAAVAGPLALLMGLAGCNRMAHTVAQATPNTPEVRARVVDQARTSCNQAALQHVGPNATPAVQTRVASYCDCIATKGLASFSNAEMAEIGLRGMNSLTPPQRQKLDDAVNLCRGALKN